VSLLIGLGYQAQAGKDTAAAAIIAGRSDKYSIRSFAFADLLKVEVFHALVNSVDPFWHFMSKFDPTIYFQSILVPKPENSFLRKPEDKIAWINANKKALRRILQVYGAEYRRSADPFYWVRKLGEAINVDPPQVALITDMRFLNEAFFVKANEGFTVKVRRIGYDNGVSNHESEQQLAKYVFDYEINVEEGDLAGLTSDALEVFDAIIDSVTPKDMETSEFTSEAFDEAA
jgi:hypothetical protein